MNRTLRRHIMNKRRRDRAMRNESGYDGNYDYGQGQYMGEIYGNYQNDYAHTALASMYNNGMYGNGQPYQDGGYYHSNMPVMTDGRQGVKYTGPYGIGGSKHYPRRDRAMGEEDYGDDEELKLTKSEMREWKEDLENADGTHGAHFELPQIEQAAQSLSIQFKHYSLKDLCLAANMLYSDYCAALGVAKDREAMIYTKMAKAFLDDPDAAVKGAEKLAAYYYAIVDDEE